MKPEDTSASQLAVGVDHGTSGGPAVVVLQDSAEPPHTLVLSTNPPGMLDAYRKALAEIPGVSVERAQEIAARLRGTFDRAGAAVGKSGDGLRELVEASQKATAELASLYRDAELLQRFKPTGLATVAVPQTRRYNPGTVASADRKRGIGYTRKPSSKRVSRRAFIAAKRAARKAGLR